MLWLLKKNRKLSSQTDGFTMIEVLVVMIIIGILSAIAAPGWLGFVNNNRLSASQSRVFSTLKDAQSTAKRSGTPTIVTIGNSATNGAFVQTSRSQAQYLEQGVQILSITQGSTNLPLSSPIKMSFNSQGFPTKEDGSKFATTDYPIRITLNMANSPRKRCTTITTLLGAMRSGSDTDCN